VIFNILFFVLKLIGILLLAVLALILLIIITVLVVPIRYTVRLEHGDLLYADIRVNWLLHLLNARISYKDEKLHIRLRLLIFTLYDSLKPKRGAKRKQAELSALSGGRKKPDNRDLSSGKNAKLKETGSKFSEADRKMADTEPDRKKSSDITGIDTQKEAIISDSDKTVYPADKKMEGKEVTHEGQASGKSSDAFEDDKSILLRIKKKIISVIEKIKAFFTALWNKFARIFKTASDIRAKIKLVTDFLQDTQNREGIRLTFTESKNILKHILPGKLKSTIRFGTGDPCSTGQALGAFSILYSFYGDNISITPDFENKVFEGKHYARGRIRLITILLIILKLIRDERFKSLKRNFLLLKEAL